MATVGTGWGRRAEFGAGATARTREDAKRSSDFTREGAEPYWDEKPRPNKFTNDYARSLGFEDQRDMRGGW